MRRAWRRAVTGLALLALAAFASAATEAQRATLAGLSVAVWAPAEATPAPLVLFSHGYGGCATQSTFLMRALADAGYLALAPDHADASCGHGWPGRPQQRFRDPLAWSDATYRERHDDIVHLVDALRGDSAWSSRIDWQRVALVGHSLGGYTVLGLAGAWPTWAIPGVKAVVAMSPYCAPYAQQHTLGGVRVPVMYQGGSRDSGVTPTVRKADGCYDQTPAPAAYVEFEGAGHFAWTDARDTYHDAISQQTITFLDRWLRGRAAAPSDVAVALRKAK